jgi:hypothetical protein
MARNTLDPLSGLTRRSASSSPAAPAKPANWHELSARDQRVWLIEQNLREQREAEGRPEIPAARVPLPEGFHDLSAVSQREFMLARGGNR